MKNILLVGLGGSIGSMLRYISYLLIGSAKPFPLATLLINIAGSLIIGLVIGYSFKSQSFATNWKLFLATGICGGFTTFSSFSLENMQLLQNGRIVSFALYTLLSLLLGLAAVFIGYKIAS